MKTIYTIQWRWDNGTDWYGVGEGWKSKDICMDNYYYLVKYNYDRNTKRYRVIENKVVSTVIEGDKSC